MHRKLEKYCPDFEIIEWNEDNIDVYQNPYTTYTYDNKRFAFLSDYLRLLIVYKEGGIYFDVDVEVVRPIDELLENQAFLDLRQRIISIQALDLEQKPEMQL